jgi:hypothetical protein
VLAILNKEQRGFLTPQKFNLFANQAQLDILEQYFYDLETFLNVKGNHTVHADQVNILEGKISKFETSAEPAYAGDGVFNLPTNLYRLSNVIYKNVIAQRIDRKEYRIIMASKLARPTDSFPVYTQYGSGIVITAAEVLTSSANLKVDYIRIPSKVEWAYVNVLGSPQYNDGLSTNFELEASEETDLVLAILKLAGVEIKDQAVYNIAAGEEQKEEQQEIR